VADQGANSEHEGDGAGAKVVSLADVAKDMRFPVLTQLEGYWEELRGTRLVPSRSEVDPRRIEDALEYAFIVERIAPGMARFRLAGMHLNDLMGMEVRGMPLTAFFTPEARKRVSAALEQVFDAPALARLSLAAERGIGRPALDARLLLLPLKSDFGDVSRALGCLVTLGPVGRAPRRFEVTGEDVHSVVGPAHSGDRRIRGWSRKRRGQPAAVRPEMSEPAAPLRHTPAPPGAASAAPRPPRTDGRPRLYLVKSDGGD